LERPAWVPNAVFYEVFVDRFANGDHRNDPPGTVPWGSPPTREDFQGGDLQGILDHLSYLEDRGVTALYLTPIFRSGTNHRYDTFDYLTVDPSVGDLSLLRRLVQKAHRRGIRVILDGVFNHCGDGHRAFEDLRRRGPASAYKDWFLVKSFPIEREPTSYQTCGGAAYLPKLNIGNPEVRKHLLDVATYWIDETDIDGWRLDVSWKVPLDFWEEFRQVVKRHKPDAYLVGENWRDGEPWLEVFDGIMNYRLRSAILDFCVWDRMDAEDFRVEVDYLMHRHGEASGWMLNLVGSHDTARLLTLANGDRRRAILAFAALFTLPGAPMVYYGDEIGLEGGDDPDCRKAMQWDTREWASDIALTFQQLADLRKAHPALQRGTWEPALEFNGVFAYRRRQGRDDVMVVLNPREAQKNLAVPLPGSSSAVWTDLLGGSKAANSEGFLRVPTVEGTSAMILVPDPGDSHA